MTKHSHVERLFCCSGFCFISSRASGPRHCNPWQQTGKTWIAIKYSPHTYSRKAKYKSLSEVRKKLQILLFQYVIFLWYYFLFMWNNWRYINSVIKVKQKYNHGSEDLLDTLMYWLNPGEHFILKFLKNVQLLMYTRFKSLLRPIVRML